MTTDEFLQVVNSNHVFICSSLAAILDAKLLSATIIYVRRIMVLYRSVESYRSL